MSLGRNDTKASHDTARNMTPTAVPSSPRRRGRRGLLYVSILLIVIVLGASLWTWLTLSWAYADGTRAGMLQKFARRGWICKTIEGDLAQYVVPGISPQIWKFSVRDPAVAAQLEHIVGHQVQLHYTEHPGVPSACFADTRFFVDHVTVTDSANATGPAPLGSGPAAPPPAPPPTASKPAGTNP